MVLAPELMLLDKRTAELVREYVPEGDVLFFTRQGMVKRSEWAEYNLLKAVYPAIKLKPGDEVAGVETFVGDEYTTMCLVTNGGICLNAVMDDIPCQGRIAAGVKGMLVDGDDFNEPIADAVRSILDGHIVLTRDLADQGHFPAIDVLRSISRLRSDICKRDDLMAGRAVLRSMSTYRKVEDMVNIGAYARGSNPEIDEAIIKMPLINNFLRQEVAEKQDVESSMGLLHAIVDAPGTLPPPQEAPAAAQNKLQKVPPVPGGLRRG